MVRNVSVSQAPPPFFKPSYQERMDDNNNNKISPTVLLIIIILAVIFFISGLLHLLVRFLVKPSQRDPDDLDNNVTALQGQLQQLFHLHDAGVDQSFIDNLPVFLYKSIIGLKNPFDCAVCLCEFEEEDKLRLLPKCSHAFHLECIDTWLLSHSTCPLCRGSLLPDISANCSPLVLVLESGSESSGRVADRDAPISAGEDEFGSSSPTDVVSQKHHQEPVVGFAKQDAIISEQPKVVPVKLGKFRNVDLVGAESSSTGSIASNVDGRRCYSMGSFEYVLDTTSLLQVSIVAPPLVRKQQGIKNRKPNLPLTPTGHRYARSECHSSTCRYGFNGFETSIREGNNGFGGSASIEKSRTESFSISKIWMRSKKKEKSVVGGSSSSRRAFSFRLPVTLGRGGDDLKGKQLSSRMSVSEMEIAEWDDDTQGNMMCSYSRSEIGVEEEHGGVHFNSSSIESHSKTPSFARRTLNWLVGRQNKIVHSSPTTAPV